MRGGDIKMKEQKEYSVVLKFGLVVGVYLNLCSRHWGEGWGAEIH